MKNYLKYDDVKVFKYDNLVLAVIYTIGHILIAMTCNRIITGASLDMAAYYNISDDLVLRFNVENLTDELYFPHSHSTHQASVGEEKNVRVSISKKF